MLNWLNSLFAGPKPAGPPQLLQAFAPEQPTITQSGIRIENGAWHIDARAEEQTIRLFEVENPAVEQCLLTYRAELKAEGLQGRGYLEMWCRLPGRGEFFSKGYKQAVSGTINWARYEIPFYLKGIRNRTLSSSTLRLRVRAECGCATSSCSRHLSRREGGEAYLTSSSRSQPPGPWSQRRPCLFPCRNLLGP